jgi:cardiolipin synthase
VVEDGPDSRQNPLALSLLALIGHARRRLWIASGYFLPTQPILDALKLAAARGVEVRILVSEKSDHFYVVEAGRSFYEELLRYGIRVYEFHRDVNHAKVILVDDKWVSIGSANLDSRSMYLNFELNLVFHDADVAGRAAVLLDTYYRHAEEIGLDRWLKRPFRRRLRESFWRPLGPVL